MTTITPAAAIAAASKDAATHKPRVFVPAAVNDNAALSGETKTALILAAVARAMNQEDR